MQGLTTLWAGLAALSLVGAPAGRVEAQGTATFIQNLGSSGNTSARTLTLTTTGAVAAGHAIIVVVAFGPGNASSVFCSDPINGTYVPGGSGGDGAPLGNTPCYLLHSAALPAGTPITINAGAEATRATAVAYEFANLVAVLGGGGAGTGTNTTNLNDPLGLTPIAAPALLFGGYTLAGTQAAPPTFIPGTNGTSTPCTNTGTPTYDATALFPSQITTASGYLQARAEWCIVNHLGQYFLRASTAAPVDFAGSFTVFRGLPVLPGDINDDGLVDIRDYGIWRQQFGAAAASFCILPADVNGDCAVDIRDYGIWRQHFGQTGGGPH